MHVGFLTKRFPNLSETFVLNQITGLLDLGHTVSIFARSSDESGIHHEQVAAYKLLSRTHYFGDAEALNNVPIMYRFWNFVRLIVTSDPATRKHLVRVFSGGPRRSTGRRLLDLFYAWSFLQSDIDMVDVLLCHFGPMGNFALDLRNAGIFTGKIATVFHGYDISQYVLKHGPIIYDDLFRHGDIFLPISHTWRQKLIDLGAPEDKVIVHKMGIDCRMFKFKERRYFPGQKIELVSVARLVEKKGIEYGIRAIASVRENHPNLRYRIAGDGPLRQQLEKLIAELHLTANVALLGWRTHDEIASLMDAAHILLAPSVTSVEGDQEGIPVALMEALAQGIPVISTRHSGIPELVHHEHFGMLTEERDVDGSARAISNMIASADSWPEMGRRGAEYVKSQHDIFHLNQNLAALLNDTISSE